MRPVSVSEYANFMQSNDSVPIEATRVDLVKEWKIEALQPDNYSQEEWTVWSFPNRGNWATHVGNYRGNWSPYIPEISLTDIPSPER